MPDESVMSSRLRDHTRYTYRVYAEAEDRTGMPHIGHRMVLGSTLGTDPCTIHGHAMANANQRSQAPAILSQSAVCALIADVS